MDFARSLGNDKQEDLELAALGGDRIDDPRGATPLRRDKVVGLFEHDEDGVRQFPSQGTAPDPAEELVCDVPRDLLFDACEVDDGDAPRLQQVVERDVLEPPDAELAERI